MKKLIVYFAVLNLLFVFGACDEKDDETPVIYETGTVMDIESNLYTTIKIGNQWWMAENLRVTTYRNGQSINDGQLDQSWPDSSGAYCLFDNNPSSPGLLYNYFAVTSSHGIAPAGWHVATDEDWKTLEKHLGMSDMDATRSGWRGTVEGNAMKLPGITGWNEYQDTWPTNLSGFSAAAGGCRLPNGVWGDPSLFSTGFWWTTTSKNDAAAYYRYLDYKKASVYRSADSKLYGFSVRCVKD